MRKHRLLFVSMLFQMALFAALPHRAVGQDQDQDQGQDPPGRVARLNYIQGSVSYQVSGDQDWVQADPNRPLTAGDNLWADQDSRGEVHIGSTAIRMSSMTGISLLTLDDRTVQLQLAQGTIEVHLRRLVPDLAERDVYVCGPPGMTAVIERDVCRCGVPRSQIHSERFAL